MKLIFRLLLLTGMLFGLMVGFKFWKTKSHNDKVVSISRQPSKTYGVITSVSTGSRSRTFYEYTVNNKLEVVAVDFSYTCCVGDTVCVIYNMSKPRTSLLCESYKAWKFNFNQAEVWFLVILAALQAIVGIARRLRK